MNKGLTTFLYGKATEGSTGAVTYATPAKLAGAIECKVALDTNSSEVYADDELIASDYSVSGGTITLGIDNDDESIFGPILGATTVSYTPSGTGATAVDTYKYKTSDTSDFYGFGYIVTKEDGYCAKFFPKVKFKPFEADTKTKGEKLEYLTPSIEGKLSCFSDGIYKASGTFTTLALAKTYLESLFVSA